MLTFDLITIRIIIKMERGIIKRIIVGPDIVSGGNMAYAIDHTYHKGTIKVTKIVEEVHDGVHWTLIFVKKVSDLIGPNYLWWKVSPSLKIQYNIDFND